MRPIHAELTRVIDAPPAVVYGIFADYRVGHQAILPPKYFAPMEIERGGTGAGTVFLLTMRAGGRGGARRIEVTEPEPGRVLRETSVEGDIVTTFTVDPADGSRRSSVTIATDYKPSGLAAWIERLIVPRLLRKIYADEMDMLNQYVAGRTPSSG